MTETGQQGPLAGIRVLDLSHVASGPFATMILADLGAEIIKVERPGSGDGIRHAEVNAKGGESGFFLGVNKGKRSIVVDLQSEEGRHAILALARWADVAIENFRPGAVDRLGIGYEAVRAVNPRIVYCSISGFGPRGPMRDRVAYDIIAQAVSGIMDITGEPDGGPAKCGAPISDLSAGAFAVMGILAALYHRALTGEGQHVETSLVGASLSLLSSYLPAAALGTTFRRAGSAHNTVAPYQAFKAGDDRYFILAAATDSHWRRAANAIGCGPLARDPRFATNRERLRRRTELVAILEETFATDGAESWVARLTAAGVPASLIYTLDDVLAEPHFREVGYIAELEHPTAGRVPVTVAPLAFSRTPVGTRLPPPRLDEQGDQIRELIRSLESAEGPMAGGADGGPSLPG